MLFKSTCLNFVRNSINIQLFFFDKRAITTKIRKMIYWQVTKFAEKSK